MKIPGFCVLLCLLCLFISPVTQSGALDDFESDATKKRSSDSSSNTAHRTSSSKSDKDDDCDSITGCLLGAIFEGTFRFVLYVAAEGGRLSTDRMQPYPRREGVIPRNKGDILLPLFRFDTHIQSASKGVIGKDLRAEFGNGPFAFQIRRSLYQESNPSDEMTLTQWHALYRMSLGNSINLNLGLGHSQLKGNAENSAVSFTFPLYVQASKRFSWEIKPSLSNFNGSGVWDFDMAGLLTEKNYSLMLGIRRLSSLAQSISGPYLGFSFHY